MRKLLKLSKDYWTLAIIVVISSIATWEWFSFNIFTKGDWSFNFSQSLSTYVTLNFSWVTSTGLGQLNLTASSWPSMFLFGAFGFLNQNSNVADKFVFMLPVVLLPGVSSYLLLKKIFRNTPAAIVGSFAFFLNIYFLTTKTGQLTILVPIALSPFLVLAFINTLEQKKYVYAVITALLGLLMSAYEFRIFYIMAAVLALYAIFHTFILEKSSFRSLLKNSILSISPLALIIILNAYWIVGLSKSGSVLHNSIFDRGLFGGQFLNLEQSLTIFHPFWNGIEPISFVVNPIPVYLWIIPTLAITGLLLNRKNPTILFFGLVAVVGLLLTKQEDAPLSNLYLWLYQHFPGFNAFREASKFYILSTLGYSVLIASLINWVWEKIPSKRREINTIWKVGKIILVISVSLLFIWNTKPFITGEIGTLFSPRKIPSDYLIVKNYLLEQPGSFRTYWAPTFPRWAIYTNEKPKVSAIDVFSGDWNNLVPRATYTVPLNQQIVSVLKQPYSKEILDESDIKYVMVPLRDEANNDDFFINYGDDRQFFIDTLNSIPYLKKINIGTKDVMVYENTSYKPYISSPTKLYQISSTASLSEDFTFANTQLGENDFNFFTSDPIKSIPGVSITDVFSDLGLDSFQAGSISKSLNASIGTVLYSSINRPNLSYQVTTALCPTPSKTDKGRPKIPFCSMQKVLSIYSENKNLVSLNSIPAKGNGDISTSLLTSKLDSTKKYIIGLGETPVPVDITDVTKNLGTINTPVTLYSQDKSNLIQNPSFEKGLWQKEVSDCNDYDNRALLGMKLDDSDSTDGKYALQLDADQHTACTGPGAIDVNSGEQYLLKFDYEVHNTKDIEYELDFDDPKHTITKEQINSPDDSWRTFNKILTIPTGATHINLFVYGIPDPQHQSHATTHYDNFVLNHLTTESPVNVNLTTSFQTLPLSQGMQTYSYLDHSYNYQNLIKNPSLENGLWQQNVGDCNNYDSNSALGIRLDTSDATNGSNSLELQARRHTACTFPSPAHIQENQTYRLSFDYSSPNGTQAGYNLSFNDPASTFINETVAIKDSKWHTTVKYFKAPPEATSATLVVYGYAGDGSQKILTRYDNFSLMAVPDIQARYFQVSPPSTQTLPPKSITYDSANPTLKYVHVTGATKPFYLAMSEAYHDQWRLEINNSSVNGRLRGWIPFVHPNAIASSQHFKLNDFENGWYVDPATLCRDNPQGCTKNADGSYNLEMQIEFVPQRWFYLGTLISGFTLLGCLSYLGIYLVRKIIRRKKRSQPKKPSDNSIYVNHLHENL